MRPAFTVLRIQKLKSWGAIAGSGKHNQRERETPNADGTRTPHNQLLVDSPEKSSVDAIKEAIGDQRIRKNAVLGVEMLLSASPEYFRPSAPEKAGSYDPDRLQSWTQASTNWLEQRYGERIIKATLHLDEATPHMHVLLVPLDDKGKLNCRALFGGTRHTLSNLQTDYAQAVATLGIERGIINSRAEHQKVSQFYTFTQGEKLLDLPVTRNFAPPEMPSKLMRMSDEQLMQYARQAASNGAKAQQEAVEPVFTATRNENILLKRENLSLKKVNSRLIQEKTAMQKQMDQVRGLEISDVLFRIFNAKGPYTKGAGHPCRYILPDEREVTVTGDSWKVPPTKRGKGAIDLVMALRGYGQQDLTKVVGELAHTFGVEKVTGECASQAIDRAAETVSRAAKEFTPEKDMGHSLEQGRGLGISR